MDSLSLPFVFVPSGWSETMDIVSLPFVLLQVVSSKQWTTWIYLLSCCKWL